MKRCPRCGRDLPLSAFGPRKDRPSGVRSRCRECESKATMEWRAASPERYARHIESMRRHGREARRKALVAYSQDPPSCACCGETTLEFLSIDHIDGGGTEERRRVGAGSQFYWSLARRGFPLGYRVLCHNCNLARGFYGYCPHEAERLEAAE